MLMDKLVTVGIKHIKFWQHAGKTETQSLNCNYVTMHLTFKHQKFEAFLTSGWVSDICCIFI